MDRGLSRSRSMPPPRQSVLSEGEEEDWGHFSCGLSEDEGDSECGESGEEHARPENETEEKKAPHVSRFASSRYGPCGACASRYPVGASACSSMKTLSMCASMAAFEQQPAEEEQAEAQSGASSDEPEKRRKRRSSSVDPGAGRRQKGDATPIEARVRKRRDDFCGDPRRGKTARWDVERWHVFAPRLLRRGGDYLPDRDGVVLSPAFRPRVATRFFKRSATTGTTVSFSMGSIRVVSSPFERYAQYELVVNVDGRTGSAWRRYSAFRALVSQVAAQSAPRHIVRTLSAWADAQDAKRIFRCTHPAYLIQRYYHFEHVLREALFELQDPTLILAFFEPDDDPVGPVAPVSPCPRADPPDPPPRAAAIRRQFPGLASFLGIRPFPNDLLAGRHQVKCH